MTTLDKLDIHHYDRLLENAMAVLDNAPKLLPANRKTIRSSSSTRRQRG